MINTPRRTAAALLAVPFLFTACSSESTESTTPAPTEPASTTAQVPAVIPGLGDEPDITLDPEVAATYFDNEAFNEVDVEFAQMMIPHHRQAVRLVDLVDGRTDSEALLNLASRMKDEQSAEVEVLLTWLKAHDLAELSGAELDEHVATMPGSISEEMFTAIEQTSGEEFEKLFYTYMIAHHQGALSMADKAVGEGLHYEIHRLAADINVSQGVQINAMQELLADLG